MSCDSDLVKVFYLAKQVRCHVEILAIQNKKNRILELGLCGFCGVASAHFYNLSKFLNVSVNFVCGEYRSKTCRSGHCWIEYKDKIIDLTATQFKKDKIHQDVFITNSNNKNYNKKAINELAFYRMRYWPKEQTYSVYRKQLQDITLLVGANILKSIQKEG